MKMLHSCWFVSTACWGLIQLVCSGFMACPGSFPSSCVEKHPNPKSGQKVDPDTPGCAMYCRGDETHPIFWCFFLDFHP